MFEYKLTCFLKNRMFAKLSRIHMRFYLWVINHPWTSGSPAEQYITPEYLWIEHFPPICSHPAGAGGTATSTCQVLLNLYYSEIMKVCSQAIHWRSRPLSRWRYTTLRSLDVQEQDVPVYASPSRSQSLAVCEVHARNQRWTDEWDVHCFSRNPDYSVWSCRVYVSMTPDLTVAANAFCYARTLEKIAWKADSGVFWKSHSYSVVLEDNVFLWMHQIHCLRNMKTSSC